MAGIVGAIAIIAWVRNRRTRNQRHMQLLENVSLASPEETEAPQA